MDNNNANIGVAEAEALGAMLDSSGWAIAERVLDTYIAALNDINTIDVNDPDIKVTIRGRILAVEAFTEWLNDIKGRVSNLNHINNTSLPTSPLVERR